RSGRASAGSSVSRRARGARRRRSSRDVRADRQCRQRTIALARELFINPAASTTERAMLKIWGRANSSNVQKVLWTCEEIGIAFERIDAGGAFGKTKEAAYLALNPNGLVPTIEDGKTVLWESNTIMRYLATTRGATRLYPTDPVERAFVERWMDWQLASLGPPMTPLP